MQIHKISQLRGPEVKTYGDLNILFLHSQKALSQLSNYNFDAIVLEKNSLLEDIRKDNRLYLKPTFLKSQELKKADGVFDLNNPFPVINKIKKINSDINKYIELKLPDNPKEQIITKLLRYFN